MKRNITLFLSFFVCLIAFSQTTIFYTGFEGPGFDEGWTIGMTTSMEETPYDYPGGTDPLEMWALTRTPQYVHSGSSAAFMGGTFNLENKYDWLMSPEFLVPTNATTNVNYWMFYQSATPNYWTWLYIMVYDVQEDTWELGELILYEESINLHYTEEYSFDLSSWEGKDIKVAFVKRGTYQFAMDDINFNCTGCNLAVNSNSQNLVKAYPNPVNNTLYIENLLKVQDVESISIIDILGREYTQKFEGTTDKVDIDFSNFSAGLYIVKINSKSNENRTFLIQKE